ncbi:hypothetical protein [Micromonospora sp. KC723]|nr:hypothetical protein [Micromonospora sp. KC723]
MSAEPLVPPLGGAPPVTGVTLVRRRHIDLMRVCSDGCRRPTP